jgi:hypothetical protein
MRITDPLPDPTAAIFVTGTEEDRRRVRGEWHKARHLRQVLARHASDGYRPVVTTLAFTGLRISEVLEGCAGATSTSSRASCTSADSCRLTAATVPHGGSNS